MVLAPSEHIQISLITHHLTCIVDPLSDHVENKNLKKTYVLTNIPLYEKCIQA